MSAFMAHHQSLMRRGILFLILLHTNTQDGWELWKGAIVKRGIICQGHNHDNAEDASRHAHGQIFAQTHAYRMNRNIGQSPKYVKRSPLVIPSGHWWNVNFSLATITAQATRHRSRDRAVLCTPISLVPFINSYFLFVYPIRLSCFVLCQHSRMSIGTQQ